MISVLQPKYLLESFVGFQNFYYTASIPFFIFINTFYMLIVFLGFINARRYYIMECTGIGTRFRTLRSLKPISIFVPCYNEEKTVVSALQAMLTLDYPDYEVIVCNDGSRDQTLNVIKEAFNLQPYHSHPPHVLPCEKIRGVYRSAEVANLIVIDKENGGKADALNACINYGQFPLICAVDSDSIIDNDGLMHVVMPFMTDDRTIATGGTVLLANTKVGFARNDLTPVNMHVTPTWLGIIQGVEYVRAFMVGRMGWDLLGCNSIISGAFGLFRKSVVIKVGGYLKSTIGEDMELVVRMQRYCQDAEESYSVHLSPSPVCWTEPPTDLRTLGNQRSRWTQGLAECLFRHRGILFRPSAGMLGTVALPFLLAFELLSAPLELLGIGLIMVSIGLGIADSNRVFTFMIATIGFGWLLSLGAIVIDQLTFRKYGSPRDLSLLLLGALVEHLGFRQLHLYWRIRGLYRWLKGQHSWGDMKRVGVAGASPTA